MAYYTGFNPNKEAQAAYLASLQKKTSQNIV